MRKWESRRDNSGDNSTSDPREHSAHCSKKHLPRVGIDSQLTDQDVEGENCSDGNNHITPDDCPDAADGEEQSLQHLVCYIISCVWDRAIGGVYVCRSCGRVIYIIGMASVLTAQISRHDRDGFKRRCSRRS